MKTESVLLSVTESRRDLKHFYQYRITREHSLLSKSSRVEIMVSADAQNHLLIMNQAVMSCCLRLEDQMDLISRPG